MKNLPILLILISVLVTTTHAQNLGGGLHIGLNASQVDGDNSGGFQRAGLIVGGFVSYALSENFEIQPELQFEQLGSANDGGLIVKMNYISLPLMANVYVPIELFGKTQDFQFNVGPVIGLLLKAEDLGGEITFLDNVDYRAMAGITFRSGNTAVSMRYGYSLTSFAGSTQGFPFLSPGARGVFHNYVSFTLRIYLFNPS
ncbi:MAG: outer membrane beta-barrel protein [Bacteroidota bacterium]